MKAFINGKLVEISDKATVHDLKNTVGIHQKESVVKVAGSRAQVISEKENIEKNARYRSIPPLTQG